MLSSAIECVTARRLSGLLSSPPDLSDSLAHLEAVVKPNPYAPAAAARRRTFALHTLHSMTLGRSGRPFFRPRRRARPGSRAYSSTISTGPSLSTWVLLRPSPAPAPAPEPTKPVTSERFCVS